MTPLRHLVVLVICVIAAYRSPDSNIDDFFNAISNSIKMLDLKLKKFTCWVTCLVQDHIDQLPWYILFQKYITLKQFISEPTRCTPYSDTLIDLIYANCPNRVVVSGVIHLSMSDHGLVFAVRKISISNKNTHKVVNVRNMKNFNVHEFRNELNCLPWDMVLQTEDVNYQWQLWKSMFMSVVEKHARFHWCIMQASHDVVHQANAFVYLPTRQLLCVCAHECVWLLIYI